MARSSWWPLAILGALTVLAAILFGVQVLPPPVTGSTVPGLFVRVQFDGAVKESPTVRIQQAISVGESGKVTEEVVLLFREANHAASVRRIWVGSSSGVSAVPQLDSKWSCSGGFFQKDPVPRGARRLGDIGALFHSVSPGSVDSYFDKYREGWVLPSSEAFEARIPSGRTEGVSGLYCDRSSSVSSLTQAEADVAISAVQVSTGFEVMDTELSGSVDAPRAWTPLTGETRVTGTNDSSGEGMELGASTGVAEGSLAGHEQFLIPSRQHLIDLSSAFATLLAGGAIGAFIQLVTERPWPRRRRKDD